MGRLRGDAGVSLIPHSVHTSKHGLPEYGVTVKSSAKKQAQAQAPTNKQEEKAQAARADDSTLHPAPIQTAAKPQLEVLLQRRMDRRLAIVKDGRGSVGTTSRDWATCSP